VIDLADAHDLAGEDRGHTADEPERSSARDAAARIGSGVRARRCPATRSTLHSSSQHANRQLVYHPRPDAGASEVSN
jgi:hypothetical protein